MPSPQDAEEPALEVLSWSWIDRRRIRVLDNKALRSWWTLKTKLGLEFTANRQPPDRLDDTKLGDPKWTHHREYRAMMRWSWKGGRVSGKELNPGWTPFLVQLREISKLSYPGERSEISEIVVGGTHPNSYLKRHLRSEFLVNALIKFRAGPKTNKIGTTMGGSPYHVPWVWCEHALVKRGERYVLFLAGSMFPSHTLYVNGEKMATLDSVELTGPVASRKVLECGARVRGDEVKAPPDTSDAMPGAPRAIDQHPETVGTMVPYVSVDVTDVVKASEQNADRAKAFEEDATQESEGGLQPEEAERRQRVGVGLATPWARLASTCVATDSPTLTTEPPKGERWDGGGSITILQRQVGRMRMSGRKVLCGKLDFLVIGCAHQAGGSCIGQGMIEARADRNARIENQPILLEGDMGECNGTVYPKTSAPPSRCRCKVKIKGGCTSDL